MAKEKVISSYTDNKFLNVPSNSLFSYGGFSVTTNFDNKIIKDFNNKLILFSNPITLETIGIDTKQSALIENNNILLNLDKTDLNTFVRFGSAYEFLRISLENIIFNYPGSLFFNSLNKTVATVLNYNYDVYNNISTLYLSGDRISNNFELIYDSSNLSYQIGKEIKNINNLYTKYDLWFSISADTTYNLIEFTGVTETQNWIIIKVIGEVFPNGFDNKVDLHIKPNYDVFTEYLLVLSDYERYLLSNRNGIKEFNFILKDPTLQDDGNISYVDTNLRWNTKDGYNVDVNTIQFENLLKIVLNIGTKYDNIKTDLIARFLSPSSLKVYDLTENGKISKLLRIYGYEFDKIREFIDSLVNVNKITYDKKNNIPDKLISNLSKVLGWKYTSLVDNDEFVNSIFNNNYDQTNLTPTEIDIELWRRILLNTNYFWKSKGTRESLKAILLLTGIPDEFINITEYIYTVDGKINPNETTLVPIDFPTNSLPYDTLGYPKAPIETNDFYFQIGGDSDSGQEYLNVFRQAGFDLTITVDNKKSWTQEGAIVRNDINTPTYYQQDSKLVLNTKEIDLSLDSMQGLEKDIYSYLVANPSIFNDYYNIGDLSGLTFLEFISIVEKKLINVKNRKTVSDYKGGWYPALYNVYMLYNQNPSGYSYNLVYNFITKYSDIFENFVNELIPSTVIIRNGGTIIRNSIINKQKFVYKRGTYLGVINTYGGLTGRTTFNYDSNLQYLGNDGATDIRIQYEYSSTFNLSYGVCQIASGSTPTTTTTTTLPPTTTTTTTLPPVTTTTTTLEPVTTTTTTTIYVPPTYYGYIVNEYTAPGMSCISNGSRTVANTTSFPILNKFYYGNNGVVDCVFEVTSIGIDVSGGGYLITNMAGSGWNTCAEMLPIPPL
jgi:hypothetical protein